MQALTKSEWNKTHNDFKSVINGQKFKLTWIDGKGSCLVPVQITDLDRGDAAAALATLKGFIGKSQLAALGEACYGEERQFFYNKLTELAALVGAMPKTYETDGQGMEAVAYLHYFAYGSDWYITERDMLDRQQQAFGLADFGQGGELGYICIEEILAVAELDLHWTPKALKDL